MVHRNTVVLPEIFLRNLFTVAVWKASIPVTSYSGSYSVRFDRGRKEILQLEFFEIANEN